MTVVGSGADVRLGDAEEIEVALIAGDRGPDAGAQLTAALESALDVVTGPGDEELGADGGGRDHLGAHGRPCGTRESTPTSRSR